MSAFSNASPRSRRILLVVGIVALLSIPTMALAGSVFDDVEDGSTHAPGIEYVAEAGITQGCTATEYCPGDPLTRAQMATFLFRSSGNDPDTDPSVNAAELAGNGPSAYTTTVFAEPLDANAGLSGATSSATAIDVLTVEDLPAGEYVVSGQVTFNGQQTTTARVICSVRLDDALVANTINAIGANAGYQRQASSPVSAALEIDDGTADLSLRCHAENLTGTAPSVTGGQARTHVIATRVGDAS